MPPFVPAASRTSVSCQFLHGIMSKFGLSSVLPTRDTGRELFSETTLIRHPLFPVTSNALNWNGAKSPCSCHVHDKKL